MEDPSMTPMARLLEQRPSLYRRALEHTRDVNEAHLLVHRVMACALTWVSAPESGPGPVLLRLIEMRSRRLAGVVAAI